MDERALIFEHLEQVTQEELYQAASETTRQQMGFRLEKTDSAIISSASNEDNILINRTIGLGITQAANENEINAIIQHYKNAGVKRYFLHSHASAQPSNLNELIRNSGLMEARGWMSFYRGSEPPPASRSSLIVRDIGKEHAADFARIASNAFGLSEQTQPMIANLVGRPNWFCYMSFSGNTPAGTGAMYIENGAAWLGFGATDPAFRGQGSQGAVLNQRIQDAIDLGCQLITTCTGEAVEGDPQHSYRNILRYGFKTAELIKNFSPSN